MPEHNFSSYLAKSADPQSDFETIWHCLVTLVKELHTNTLNIISGTAGGRTFRKKKIEPIEIKRLWFDVTYRFEEFLNAFD